MCPVCPAIDPTQDDLVIFEADADVNPYMIYVHPLTQSVSLRHVSELMSGELSVMSWGGEISTFPH